MRGFIFSLASILDMRREQEIKAAEQVEILQSKLNALQHSINQIKQHYFDTRESLNTELSRSEMNHVNSYDLSLEKSKKKMLQLLEAIRDIQEDLSMAQDNYMQCKKNVKVLEIMKDKRLKEFLSKETRLENLAMDDFAHRKQRNSP